MGTCENVLNSSCPFTNTIPDSKKLESNELDELENNATLQKLIECQQEIDKLGKHEYDQILEEIKSFDVESKQTLKERFGKRNEVIGKIPGFWVKAIMNNPKLPFSVSECEIDCLKYLSCFELDELADKTNEKTGFNVSFKFNDNPYIENDIITKQFSWGIEGIISSTSTPIIWKKDSESNPLQEELLKALCGGSRSFFEWVTDNEGPTSINFLQLLELWQDPLSYFMLSGENLSQIENEENNALLNELKKYQEDINEVNKKLDDELAKSTSLIGISTEELKKGLYEDRKRLIQEIPNFWGTVISNHPDLYCMIGEDEKDCLKYLTHVELEDMKCSDDLVSKMNIHFHFSENNPYMVNSVISKEYTRRDGERSVKNTPIEWKENKCLFSKQECGDGSSKSKDRKSGNFFDWLNDDSSPEGNSHITLPVLQLWEDPVHYYIKAVFKDVFDDCSH